MKKILLPLLLISVFFFGVSYKDVPVNHWAYDAVMSVTELGIISGYPDGTFRGNDFVSRYQLAVAIYRVIEYIKKFGAVSTGETGVSKEEVTRIEAKIASLKDFIVGYIKKNDEKITEISLKIDSLSMDLSNTMEVVSKVSKDVDETFKKLEALESTLTELKTDVEKISLKLSEMEKFRSYVDSKFKEQGSNVLSLEREISKVKMEVKKVNETLDLTRITFDSSLTVIQNDFSKKIKTLEKKMQDINSKIEGNSSNILKLKADLSRLEKSISNLMIESRKFSYKKDLVEVEENLNKRLDERTSALNNTLWVSLALTWIVLVVEGIYLLHLGGVF